MVSCKILLGKERSEITAIVVEARLVHKTLAILQAEGEIVFLSGIGIREAYPIVIIEVLANSIGNRIHKGIICILVIKSSQNKVIGIDLISQLGTKASYLTASIGFVAQHIRPKSIRESSLRSLVNLLVICLHLVAGKRARYIKIEISERSIQSCLKLIGELTSYIE